MASKIVIGKNDSTSKNQFRINPLLQRTRASGAEHGVTLGTAKPSFAVVQNDIVTLPNRSIPRNLDKTPNKKKTPNDQTGFQGTPVRRK